MFWEIRRYTSLEMSFNAIERVVEFMEMDQEAPTITQLRPPTEVKLNKYKQTKTLILNVSSIVAYERRN